MTEVESIIALAIGAGIILSLFGLLAYLSLNRLRDDG
jgi:hypothetical protein